MISGGSMKWSATVYERSLTDSHGKHKITTNATSTTFRAALYDLGGAEGDYADGVAEDRFYEVKTRFTTALNDLSSRNLLRLTDGVSTIDMEITSIRNESMKNRVIVFSCQQVVLS
jgi:hypothetical protein